MRGGGGGGGGGGDNDDDDDEIKGTCVLYRAYVCITLLIGLEQRASRVTGRREPAGGPSFRFPILTFLAPAPHIPGSRFSFSLSSSFLLFFDCEIF